MWRGWFSRLYECDVKLLSIAACIIQRWWRRTVGPSLFEEVLDSLSLSFLFSSSSSSSCTFMLQTTFSTICIVCPCFTNGYRYVCYGLSLPLSLCNFFSQTNNITHVFFFFFFFFLNKEEYYEVAPESIRDLPPPAASLDLDVWRSFLDEISVNRP
jgi:hypothetical protein